MYIKTVSVVIPFYNNVDWLIQAVESVLNQTYKAHEIIVINDGSKEDMRYFLKQYGNRIKYIKKENEGPAIARNAGIERSEGDYIAFLDSDDIWMPEKLEIQIKEMIDRNAIWSQTSYKTFIDGQEMNEHKMIIKDTSIFKGNIYPIVLASCWIATPCIIIDGDLLRNNTNLRFNSDMRHGQDSYLWLNLSIDYPLVEVSKPLTMVRIRGNNAALRAKVQIKAKAIIWSTLKNEKEKYRTDSLPFTLKIAFVLSKFGNSVVCNLDKIFKSNKLIELISRFLYLLPWLFFKGYSKLYFKRMNKPNSIGGII